MDPEDNPELEPLQRMARDMNKAGATLGKQEARFLVDSYYAVQDYRIQAGGQIRALGESEEPHTVIQWQEKQMSMLEETVKRQLGRWAEGQRAGRWALSITGIGPVLAAGFLSNIDIEKAPTVGHIWRFAGLDPTVRWGKGEKRPWNARLKVLCWKAGESFVKVQNNDHDVYGKVYAERKALEMERNDAGAFAEQAAASLVAKKYGKDTEAFKAYTAGRLPQARIHLRATRYATKLFLSHLHHVLFESTYGTPPPKPYILTQPNHVHFISPPGWPID